MKSQIEILKRLKTEIQIDITKCSITDLAKSSSKIEILKWVLD